MATIFIDNQPYEIREGQSLLQQCLTLGLDIPYFCWHPALGAVGACRQCAVKEYRDENDTQGRVVMSCMTPTKDGMRISVDDPQLREFRAHVIEWLMENHPHDCPICDEGGECHLQDMTVMSRHTYRRYRFKKKTFRNQDLGPCINHEMNRCITCYRCVRFYQDYAGGHDLRAFASKDHVYFGRHTDGTLESEFSGNLVEICPTGVFTDKTLKKHYTRKWDLQTSPSICVHCGLGCNIIVGERYGKVRRILNRYNGQVNGYFLCDRGRFGYEFVNSDNRLRQPSLGAHDRSASVTKPQTLAVMADLVRGDKRLIGIGSPRASLEANFALKTLVGVDRFYLGTSDNDTRLAATILEVLQRSPAKIASLYDVERADAVLILGEDVSNTAPRLALALRQALRTAFGGLLETLHIRPWLDRAVRQASALESPSPIYIATPNTTRIDDIAKGLFRAAPDDIARLGFAIGHKLSAQAPEVTDLTDEMGCLATAIAGALRQASHPLIISGSGCVNPAVIHAAANVAVALCEIGKNAQIHLAVAEVNSLGLAMIGGGRLSDAFEVAQEDGAPTVIVLENDLYRRAPRPSVDACLQAAGHVIVIDHTAHNTTTMADCQLPAATFAESSGTFVSSEARAQRFFSTVEPGDDVQDSWRWIRDMAAIRGSEPASGWNRLDDVTVACAQAVPLLHSISDAAPNANFRAVGQRIPREPHRASGRTAIHAQEHISEHRPPTDPDSPLAFSMEGAPNPPPAALIPIYWAPRWNSVAATAKYQSEVGGPLRGGDPGVRLIEPMPMALPIYAVEVPAAFQPRSQEWLILPLYSVFGSEELSAQAPAVADRSPSPHLCLNPKDAAAFGGTEDSRVGLTINGDVYDLPIQIMNDLPVGIAGLPAGLPGIPTPSLPAWGTLAQGLPL
ncbi:NADH-quinone oxidoreductase subunit NuoG [Acidiferrobacter thiooxydans]